MVTIQRSFAQEKGARLFLCSTPIGNLADVSQRLLDTLRHVDVVLAEDTRHTRKLLTRYDIHPPAVVSYHLHNAHAREPDLLQWWREARSIALVTDAGTPGISDPGAEASALAWAHAVPVIPIPGPTAAIAALVASGLPAQPFSFYGFLPRTGKRAREALEQVASLPGSVILYESPLRLAATLRRLAEHMPQREAVVARELTKLHETFVRGSLLDLAAWAAAEQVKGECVLVISAGVPHSSSDSGDAKIAVAGADPEIALAEAVAAVRQAVQDGSSHTDAVRRIAAERQVPRSVLYQATLQQG